MPSAPIVTCARIFPLLAAVTPRSRYLKKERRPSTRGAVTGVAYASLPGGLTAAGCPIGVVASFIMEASSAFVVPSSYRRYYPIRARLEGVRVDDRQWPPRTGTGDGQRARRRGQQSQPHHGCARMPADSTVRVH